MCGISGFLLGPATSIKGDLQAIVRDMGSAIAHRGFDMHGDWVDRETGVALTHQRLSIIDLSMAGHQPMVSSCGRFVLTYNGEIYNAPSLRDDLRKIGREFRGQSDTEVLVEGIAAWGLQETVERAVGMFAFAVWDRQQRRLSLVRDRMGIKPLFYAHWDGAVLFGSELKALYRFPGFAPEIDKTGVASFLRYGYVPAPQSIFRQVSKLEPGTITVVTPGGEQTTQRYWSLTDVVRTARSAPVISTLSEATEVIEPLLTEAVRCRMLSDVPIGTFLSGGIDSSLVTALMQSVSNRPVRSFSIGFTDDAFDEAPHARAVADVLGTDHTELYVQPEDALEIVPRMLTVFDEPFADSSQIPTFLLSELTRSHVTVALSGDGGDELFAGYNRYLWSASIDRTRRYIPRPFRQLGANMVTRISTDTLDRIFGRALSGITGQATGYRMHKFAQLLTSSSGDEVYRTLVSQWFDLAPDSWEVTPDAYTEVERSGLSLHEERMQFLDLLTYLPDDILAKVDRTSMAHALEVRVPLLDHRVVEAAWTLGPEAKLKGREGKQVLRAILDRYVPREIVDRPKMGFGVPLARWLRYELRDWANDILGQADWENDFGLDGSVVRKAWAQHLAGEGNWAYRLWVLIMLAGWHQTWCARA